MTRKSPHLSSGGFFLPFFYDSLILINLFFIITRSPILPLLQVEPSLIAGLFTP